jgi:glyoxylase-like metal-dependent hydrolase (beta-lactamase superfamily II)
MLIRTVVVGPLQVNCYIVSDGASGKAVVIDPGDEPDMVLAAVKKDNLDVQYIICTHGHFDHIGAVVDLKQETGAKVVLHADDLLIYDNAKPSAALWGFSADEQPAPDLFVKDGDILEAGGLRLEVFHCPGHSPGGICLYGDGVVFTGDTLFAGSVGRTDFHGGDMGKLRESFRRLMALPDDTRVFSGHGAATTIGREKRENMFAAEFLR